MQSRRGFMIGAGVALVAGPALVREAVVGDGIALTSMAHPETFCAIDLAAEISSDATYVCWYTYDELKKRYIVDWNGDINEWRTYSGESEVLQHREGLRIHKTG